MLLNFNSVIASMPCTEKCKACSPLLSIFSILVTADMPVEGFSSFVYDPNDTMPYKFYSYRDNGASSQIAVYALVNSCEDILGGFCGCPDSGGWNCYGIAAGTRSQIYNANATINSITNVRITPKGNYRKEIITNLSKTSTAQIANMNINWGKQTTESLKTINGQLDPSSTSTCRPEVYVPNPLCAEVGGVPPPCERSCADHPYTNGGCSNSTADIAFMPASTCTTSTKKRTCAGSSSQTIDDNCPGDSWMRVANISSEESVASQVTEAEILSMARQAATKKVNLKKENKITSDDNQNITGDYDCYRVTGFCSNEDSEEGGYEVDTIISIEPGDENHSYDDCDVTFNSLPQTCNCSPDDKDACWDEFGSLTTPSEFSYTNITIGAFKIATNINREEFSKEYKRLSGTVYFYIDSESEPETSPCCTECGGIECFTGEIVGTSTYSISAGSNQFKQNTRVASDDLTYIYDSSELYAIHPGKVIKVCYTVDNLEFF